MKSKGFDQPELDESRAGVLLYPSDRVLKLLAQRPLLGIDAAEHAYSLLLIPGNIIIRCRALNGMKAHGRTIYEEHQREAGETQ